MLSDFPVGALTEHTLHISALCTFHLNPCHDVVTMAPFWRKAAKQTKRLDIAAEQVPGVAGPSVQQALHKVFEAIGNFNADPNAESYPKISWVL